MGRPRNAWLMVAHRVQFGMPVRALGPRISTGIHVLLDPGKGVDAGLEPVLVRPFGPIRGPGMTNDVRA